MHFQYTVFGPPDEFHGFIQICYYECPHISGIYLESLLNSIMHMIDQFSAVHVKLFTRLSFFFFPQCSATGV